VKTLLVTEARPKLGHWVQRALDGEDVGLLWKGEIVALRPVTDKSDDWLLQEYNVTAKQADKSLRRAEREIRRARRIGKMKPYTGDRRSLLEN